MPAKVAAKRANEKCMLLFLVELRNPKNGAKLINDCIQRDKGNKEIRK